MVFRLHNNGIDLTYLFNFCYFFWKIGGSLSVREMQANALRLSNVTLSPELRGADTCHLAEKTGEIGSFGKTETFGNLGH